MSTSSKKKTVRPHKTTKSVPIGATADNEADSTYLLKLVLFVILGTFWVKLANPLTWLGVPVAAIPFGLLIGLVLVRFFERFQTDRKIWYASLIIVTIIAYFVPAGVVL